MDKAIKTTWRHASPEITRAFCTGLTATEHRHRPSALKLEKKEIKGVQINGVKYDSVRDAATKTLISESRIYQEIKQANSRIFVLDIASMVKKNRKLPLTINGVIYKGYAAASKGTGLSQTALRGRFVRAQSNTITIETEEEKSHEIVLEGIKYSSVKKAMALTKKTRYAINQILKEQNESVH